MPSPHLRSSLLLGLAAGVVIWACHPMPAESQPGTSSTQPKNESLRSVASFSSLKNKRERSVALFNEASKVLQHPRCVNCHPSDASPRQGDQQLIHSPPVSRGPKDQGVPAMECTSCHQDQNLDHARVPGAPNWHLAPIEMAWLGRSPGQICNQIKDKQRNGGKSLDALYDHMAHDALVAWGWNPGHGRTPAPGSQETFAALIRAWLDTGAECPPEEAKR